MKKTGKSITYSQNITISNFFFRFVVQQNQFLLANGLQLNEQASKDRLGPGFDKILEAIGEKALVHGTGWGFWNYDHLEMFEATQFFALLDERTSEPRAGIRFWQIDKAKPMYIQLYEADGLTEYVKKDSSISVYADKRAYKRDVRRDGLSTSIVGESNYGNLPIVPLYANEYKRSEFTPNIKSKIDMYDKISSDFGDNLERTNDVYWVISNFGGSTDEIKTMLAEIEELRAVYSETDGSGNSTAIPHTVEVPYAARQTALDILERALYSDYMAMNMDEIRGGSLTNVAIRTAMANLEMKTNRFEWQAFQFVQKVLRFVGVDTENIKFRRQQVANEAETMTMLMQCRDDLDLQTALEKNPMIQSDEVANIMERLALEQQTAAERRFPLLEDGDVQEGVTVNG